MKFKVIIIAEAGVNHNGDFENAKKLILTAANAGADYVKFQTFKADKLVSTAAQKAEYQKANLKEDGDSQYDMLKKLEMSEAWHYDLIKYANECGIKFLSTGFDEDSIDFLDSLNIDLFKVPSGEITNKPYLEHIAKKGKPIVISTGMSNMQEIKDAVEVIQNHQIDKNKITILHCNTEYPTSFEDVNLRGKLITSWIVCCFRPNGMVQWQQWHGCQDSGWGYKFSMDKSGGLRNPRFS